MKINTKALSVPEMESKQYNCVDLFKFICALLVVSVHITPFSSYNKWINYGLKNYLARMAVPFFFVASGYFLFRKTSYERFDKTIILTYARRILRLYIVWTAIYFPWVLRNSILRDEKGIIHGLLTWIRGCLFTGSYTQLWYLNATIVATLMLTFCINKRIKVKTIIAMASGLYAIGLLPQTYSILLEPLRNIKEVWMCLKIVQKVILTTRNGFFEGFLFMGIGMVFAYKPIVMKFKTAIVGFVGSMILFFIEAVAVRYFEWVRENDMYIFLVPATFFMFYIVSHIEMDDAVIYKHLRDLGTLIFYLHLFISPFVGKGLSLIGIDNSLIMYGATVFITTIVSECVIQMSSKISRFRWLKMIYV